MDQIFHSKARFKLKQTSKINVKVYKKVKVVYSMKKWLLVIGILAIVGIVSFYMMQIKTEEYGTSTSPNLNQEATEETKQESVPSNEEESSNELEFVGPGGCKEDECNVYCAENSEECDQWCGENPQECEVMMNTWGNDDIGQPQPDEENNLREGDGVWEKSELNFYINDEENILTDNKRKIIQDVFFSEKESNGGFWGWNAALQELNSLYPNNNVPDKFIEVDSEEDAEFLIILSSEEEYCCDYGGDPVKGRERSEIDSNFARIKSRIWMYDVIDMEDGFFGDIFRHEVGHGIGLFGHVTNRNNDLMSIISPASVIKKGNLDDLYIKYRDRIIESNEEASQRDIEVKDKKFLPPS